MAAGDHVMRLQEKLALVKAKIRSKVSGAPATADALETIPLPQDDADATNLHPRYAKTTPRLHTPKQYFNEITLLALTGNIVSMDRFFQCLRLHA